MDDVRDVAINLIAALIGAVATWSVARFRRWRRERRARRFWGGMSTRGVTVVIGAQDREVLGHWEPSGLVGMGDVAGLITIQRELQGIGCEVKVSPVDSLSPEDRERDLVLLGGPDANALSRATVEHYDGTLSITVPGSSRHIIAFHDEESGQDFQPRYGAEGNVIHDYGLIVRVPNPLSNGHKTEVLILAGCWGYGTAGAAEAVCDSDFQQGVDVRKNQLCVVEAPETALADGSVRSRGTGKNNGCVSTRCGAARCGAARCGAARLGAARPDLGGRVWRGGAISAGGGGCGGVAAQGRCRVGG